MDVQILKQSALNITAFSFTEIRPISYTSTCYIFFTPNFLLSAIEFYPFDDSILNLKRLSPVTVKVLF